MCTPSCKMCCISFHGIFQIVLAQNQIPMKKKKGGAVWNTVFAHIVSAETILYWIWKYKGHSA